MKVLHVSTWKIRCGIAACTESLVENLAPLGVESHTYPISPYDVHVMVREDLQALFRDARRAAQSCDLVHVQHEFGFFGTNHPDSISNFGRLLRSLRRANRPVLATFHTDPHFPFALPTSRAGLKQTVLNRMWRWLVARQFHGRKGCHALVHTAKGRQALIHSGMACSNVAMVPMGHEPRAVSKDADQRRRAKRTLGLPPDAVLLSMFGFISAYKGHMVAVKALKSLPKNYVLAIIGGRHPCAGEEPTMNAILRAWRKQDPKRLLITGYADRPTIDLYQQATDICLAPYMPSFNLSASAALTWALTSGRPTIASGIPVFEDINRRGECLMTVTPGAAEELAWTVQRLARDEPLQARLVEKAQAYAEANSWRVAAERNHSIYERVLLLRGAPRRLPLRKPVGLAVSPETVPLEKRWKLAS
jgi:glycosyltransferase involved in cell wall biosynthesis